MQTAWIRMKRRATLRLSKTKLFDTFLSDIEALWKLNDEKFQTRNLADNNFFCGLWVYALFGYLLHRGKYFYNIQVITDAQVSFLFKRCQGNTWDQQSIYLNVLYSIAKRYPDKIQPHFSKLIDDKTFGEQTLPIRASVITCAVGRNEVIVVQI